MAEPQKTPSYEELKASVFPAQNNPSSISLTTLANAAFAAKKWTDIAAIASFGLLFAFGAPVAALLVPTALASATLGLSSAAIAYKRADETGAERPQDTEEVRGFRSAFRRAATGLMGRQVASAVLTGAAPFMLFFGFAYAFAAASGGKPGADAAALVALAAPLASLAGVILGHKAKADNTKMNVYEAVIKRETGESPRPPGA